jgi:cell division protein FtsN
MRAIVALAVGVALIALAAVVFLSPRPTAQTVALEPIEATPQRVETSQSAPSSSSSPMTPESAPVVKPTQPLEPRATPPASPRPAVDELPEPSERPTDVQEPGVSSDNPSSDTASSEPPSPQPVAAPSSLPVRETAQGWGVQAGAFKTEANATALRDRLLRASLAARVDAGSDGIYRVIVGAYASADDARVSVARVLAALR